MRSTERHALFILLAISSCVLSWSQGHQAFAQPGLQPAAEFGTPTAPVESPMATPRPRPDGRFRLQFKDGSMVIGKLSLKESLKVKSVLGEVNVPPGKLVSVEFQDDPKSTRLTLRNGDRITGELAITAIKLETSWAELSIEPKHLRSIVSNEHFSGQTRIRRAISVRDAEGNEHIRFVEELVPTGGYGAAPSPYAPTYPGTLGATYSAPSVAPPALTPAYAPAPAPAPLEAAPR